MKQGRTKVFTGITDVTGRFTTPPIEPGVYTFELRALKTAPPAQYFLILSGAKPVTAAMADKNAVLMMNAQVRTARSVTGQVTARRLRIVPPADASAAANQPAMTLAPTPAATPTAVLSRSQAVAVGRTAAPARVAVPARIVTPTRAGTVTTAPAAVPAPPVRAAAQMRTAAPVRAASPSAPRNQAAPAATPTSGLVPRPVGYQSKMINGRPHVWVPMAPGSTLGRWVPGRP